MAVPSTVITGPLAALELDRLGVTADELREALRIGYTAGAGCTEHDPRILPGILAWGKGIGNLRDVLKPRRWRADRTENFETAVHPTGSHAIALAAGTSQTGCRDGIPPSTRRPRGKATVRAVRRNAQLQLGYGTGVFGEVGRDVDESERETWLLLHFYDSTVGEIRVELSCPLEMEGAHITRWRQRIMLDPIAFAGEINIPFNDDEIDETIEIDVQRKVD